MDSIEKIKAHYGFTTGDIRNLQGLKPVMERHADEFVAEFYDNIKSFEDTHLYLKDQATVRRHQDALKVWFMNLFSGDYGARYFSELERVGAAHVKITLPAHYVNAAMHFVKMFTYGVVHKEVPNPDERSYLYRSIEKILDMNLDIFTSSYIEEEKKFFLSQRVESYLVQLSHRFSYGMNLVLVIGLVFMGLMVMGLFVYDLSHVFQSGEVEKSLLSSLGSLLMLWVVIELMDTEIRHLRGGKFAVKVFISVALVAIIRKILIASLRHEAVEAQLSLIAAVAVFGVVYWLIAKVE